MTSKAARMRKIRLKKVRVFSRMICPSDLEGFARIIGPARGQPRLDLGLRDQNRGLRPGPGGAAGNRLRLLLAVAAGCFLSWPWRGLGACAPCC